MLYIHNTNRQSLFLFLIFSPKTEKLRITQNFKFYTIALNSLKKINLLKYPDVVEYPRGYLNIIDTKVLFSHLSQY